MVLDEIEIKINKKQIKNIYIRIKPPYGEVVVSAPLNMSDEDIRIFVQSKLAWIKRHQKKYSGIVKKQLMTGENVYLWGSEYRLVIEPGTGEAVISDKNIILKVPKTSSLEQRQLVLNSLYRAQLAQKISEYAPIWQQHTGLFAAEWKIRNMKTRWGSCNTVKKRIWLSLALAQKPVCCLEYVIVHELCHLLVPNHGQDFKMLMDRFYPEWRTVKKLLNGGL